MKFLATTVLCAALIAQGCSSSARHEKTVNNYQTKSLPNKANILGAPRNPVKTAGPIGQKLYLSRLRCPNEKPPKFHRVGNFGLGPHGNIIDGYEVKCEAPDNFKTIVFMDMYFNHVETNPIQGFTIVASPDVENKNAEESTIPNLSKLFD